MFELPFTKHVNNAVCAKTFPNFNHAIFKRSNSQFTPAGFSDSKRLCTLINWVKCWTPVGGSWDTKTGFWIVPWICRFS